MLVFMKVKNEDSVVVKKYVFFLLEKVGLVDKVISYFF